LLFRKRIDIFVDNNLQNTLHDTSPAHRNASVPTPDK